MSVSLHAASIGVFRQHLIGLDLILDKLAAHCAEQNIDESVYLTARLFPDMFAFTRQVQVACDFAKNPSFRLAGAEPPALADDEKSIADLKARIAKTLALIATLAPGDVDAGDARMINFRTGPETQASLPGAIYLSNFALPNFFFHITTAYAILRNNGLAIGKRDFFGPMPA
jgi:hypothetical protein